jgi:hypothetical protein
MSFAVRCIMDEMPMPMCMCMFCRAQKYGPSSDRT